MSRWKIDLSIIKQCSLQCKRSDCGTRLNNATIGFYFLKLIPRLRWLCSQLTIFKLQQRRPLLGGDRKCSEHLVAGVKPLSLRYLHIGQTRHTHNQQTTNQRIWHFCDFGLRYFCSSFLSLLNVFTCDHLLRFSSKYCVLLHLQSQYAISTKPSEMLKIRGW